MSKVIEAQLKLSATETVSKTFDHITQSVKAASDKLKQAADYDAIVSKIKPLENAMSATARASAAMATQVKQDAATVSREASRLGSAVNLSAPLRRDLQALQLNRKEIGALSRDVVRMAAEQEKALAAIGNPKNRAQVMAADRGNIEGQIRAHAEALSTKRKAEEQFAAQIGAVNKAQLADQIRSAREKAKAAREAEREATRSASEGARERAAIARQEANAELRAARETARALRAARQEEARAARGQHAYEHRIGHVGRGVLAGAGAAYGAHQAGHYGREIIEKGAEYQREQARGYLAGLTPDEQKHANAQALEMQQRFPSINRVQVLEHLRSLRGTFGDMHHAEQALPDILKSQVVLGSLRGNDRAAHDLDQVVKGLEGAGLAANPAKFNTMLDSFLKASSLFGDTITGEGFREYIQNSKSSKYGLSESYLAGVVPTMMQHDGAGQFGTMQRMAFSALIGDRQTKKATAKQAEFGLRDKKGKLVDQEAFVSDPYQWAVDHIMPGLNKRGIDLQGMGREKGAILLTKMFSNANAGEFFASLLMNQSVVEKDRANLKLAKGREAADPLRTLDPNTSLLGLSQAVSTFAQALSSPIVKDAPQYMNALTDGINKLSGWMEKHPQEVKAGTEVAAAAGAVVLPSIVGHSMKALAGEGTGVMANALRLGGGALTGVGMPTLMTALGAGFAGYATSQEYAKTFKERGPGGFDPATGSTVDANPMSGLAPSTPWAQEWWKQHMPTWAGGAEEAGKTAGEAIGKGLVTVPLPPRRPAMLDDFRTKADETGAESGKTLMQRLMEAVAAGIDIKVNFQMGDVGKGGEGSGVQRASFGGAGSSGGAFAGLIHRANVGGSGGFTGDVSSGGRASGGSFGGGQGGPGATNANFTGENAEALKRTAAGLGISAKDLATVVSYETRGTFSPSVVGGAGNRHQGLIQAGPNERRDYGIDGGQSFPEQLQGVARYLRHRGVKPGMGIADIYSAINAGRPGRYGANDGNGTVAEHVERMVREHGARADMFLGGRGGGGDFGGLGAGLRVKGGLGGQAFAGGPSHGAMMEMAKLLQGGGGVNRFTAFNDRHHAGTGSLHARGLAMDVTGNAAKIMANARAAMEVAGLVEGKDFKLINEYVQRSKRWTGGHVDFRFLHRGAADKFSETYGKRIGRTPSAAQVPAAPDAPTIPAAPSSLKGGGSGDFGAAVERFHAGMDRLENASMHARVEVVPSGGLRARGMRSKTQGAMTGDVGVSMPGARESSDDWL